MSARDSCVCTPPCAWTRVTRTISDQLPGPHPEAKHTPPIHTPPTALHSARAPAEQHAHTSPHTLAEAIGAAEAPVGRSLCAEFRGPAVLRERSDGAETEHKASLGEIHARAISEAHTRPARPSGGSGYLHEGVPGVSAVSADGASALDTAPSALPAAGADQVRHHADLAAQMHGLAKRASEELVSETVEAGAHRQAAAAEERALHEQIEAAKRA